MTASADLDVAAQNALVTAARDGIELFTIGKLAQADRPVDETGIRLTAASGPVTIQAQSDQARLASQQNVEIASTSADVDIAAREHVLLTALGAYLRLSGGNIEIHVPGNVVLHASQKVLAGPAFSTPELPFLPTSQLDQANWKIDHRDAEDLPMARQRYKIFFEGNTVIAGALDERGHARHDGIPPKALRVEYQPREARPEKAWEALQQIVGAARV